MATSDGPPVSVPNVTLALARGASAASGNWVFQAQSYLSPLVMEAIYPRPDAETRTASFHRKAHTGLNYRIPVGVRGGCWPYRYEIISGPTGATIGQELTRTVDDLTGKTLHTVGAEYGVITWDASGETDGSAFSFTVRVTDQLGFSVDLTWSGTVDNAAFVFLDSVSGSDANAGTQAAPLQTFANGLWKNSDVDATYANKIAVCSGTMGINAGTLDTSPILDDAVKPVAFVGNGTCTFNTSRGHFRTSSALDDPLFIGINFDGSRSDLSNNRIFNFTDVVSRPVFFECSWNNTTFGTVGNDNPGCLCFMGGAGALHNYIFVSKCEIRSGCKAQLIVTFDSNRVLFERNFGTGLNIAASNGDYCLHPKDDTSNLTVRANTFSGTVATAMIGVSNQNTLTPLIENQEVCYNTLVFEGDQGVDGALVWDTSSTTPDGQNTHGYRNSIVSETSRAYRSNDSSTDGFKTFGFADVCVGGGSAAFRAPEGAPVIELLTASDFDASGRLVGSARSTYLGTHGAELAGGGS